jgi:hypothetical protein
MFKFWQFSQWAGQTQIPTTFQSPKLHGSCFQEASGWDSSFSKAQMQNQDNFIFIFIFTPYFILFITPNAYSIPRQGLDNNLNLYIAPYSCPDIHSRNSMKASIARNVNVKSELLEWQPWHNAFLL